MAPSLNCVLQDSAAAAASDDSDTEPDPDAAYYRPITAAADDSSSSDDDDDDADDLEPNGAAPDLFPHRNPNPSSLPNGVSALHLNGSCEGAGGEEEEEEEEETEASISRAFIEDESRRAAPLAPEAAARITDLMRGVSFQGMPPVWIDEIPEDRWVDQLRRLRGEPATRT